MKQFLFMAIFLLSLISGSAQDIGQVIRSSSGKTEVYNKQGSLIKTGYTGNDAYSYSLYYSECLIVIRTSTGRTEVFDSNLNGIATGFTGNDNYKYSIYVNGCDEIILTDQSGNKTKYSKKLN